MGVGTTVMVITIAALASNARADDSLLLSQQRIARDAAAHGHCDVVAQIAAQVAQTDHTYYTITFLADPTLGYCLGAPGAQRPLKIEQPVVATPTLEGTPPLDGSRIAGEVLLGGTGAFVGGILGLYLGVGLALDCHTSDCNEYLVGGGLVGVTLGASFGVLAVGSRDHQHGSVGATLAGAAAGSLAGWGVATQLDNKRIAVLAIIALPVVSSTVMFNLTRGYNVVPVPTSHGLALAGTF